MKFLCPFCKQKLEADKNVYGEFALCPSCENKILVPCLDLLKIEAQCPCCEAKFFIEENINTHKADLDVLDIMTALVDYEAQEREKLPVLEDINNANKTFFENHEVCFTGFDEDEKKDLKELAINLGMTPRTSVTKDLTMLVCGRNAGPSKLQKAKEREIKILTIQEFTQILTTGNED